MSIVYINGLVIENFGPFYGCYEFNFSDLDGNCGILIGGKNGAGKTHLLRALYLAAVGESGAGDLNKMDRDSDATRFNLDNALNNQAGLEGQDTIKLNIMLSQRDEASDVARTIRLCREIRFRPNSPPTWKSYADKMDGSPLITDQRQLEKLRDAFLPRHLARFFFFDAEKSQSLNLRQEDVVGGVSRILGLWSYAELEHDLRSLMANKIPRIFNSAEARDATDKLSDLNAQISHTERLLTNRSKEQNYQSVELSEAEGELREVEDELKSIGAVDPEVLAQTQDRRSEIAAAKAKLEEQLKTAWESALPMSLLGDFRKDFHDTLLREEKRRNWESSKATIEPKIPQIKQDLFEDAPPEFKLADDTYFFYAARLEKALHRLFHPPPEGMAAGAPFVASRSDISAQVRGLLAGGAHGVAQLAQGVAEIDRLDAELREVDGRLKGFSQSRVSIQRGQELHQKRGELIAQRDRFVGQLADLEIEVGQLQARLTELRGQETIQESLAQKAEQGRDLATLAARYREATTRIREVAAVQLREHISQTVGALWTEIVERQNEFSGLEFDAHWGCYLVRVNGERVAWEGANTSAGQRQVRMLAFYEALRQHARAVPPLVVDTPLGRLDREVRANVLDRLYLSGHQSLILSTNSEIDPDSPLFQTIRPRLARVYTLHSHGEPGTASYQVRVTNDYFGQTL